MSLEIQLQARSPGLSEPTRSNDNTEEEVSFKLLTNQVDDCVLSSVNPRFSMQPINDWNAVPATTRWSCDSCGQIIIDSTHGWVEWLVDLGDSPKSPRGRAIRIVHCDSHSPRSRGCRYRTDDQYRPGYGVYDMALTELMGPDGLMNLLEMISEKELSSKEILEIIKRIHIPRYEETRSYFDQAIQEGAFESNSLPGYYSQWEMDAVLEWLQKMD